MNTQLYIAIEGLEGLSHIPEFTPKVEKALVQALNRTADRGRTSADKRIREQVNFPASYLRPSQGRLKVIQRAGKGHFEARIRGRDRTTSLARFSRQKYLGGGNRRHAGGGVRVSVKKGGPQRMIQRAFIMKLRNNNLGLAVRTDGSKPKGAFKPKEIGKGLWLLYGPSIDQVLSAATDGDGVVEEMTPETLEFLESEFERNLQRMGL
jgi:hypothetical protein